ncbi:MAG: hypothetical protein ACRECH_10670 [Nitrososphaerales archaeon]
MGMRFVVRGARKALSTTIPEQSPLEIRNMNEGRDIYAYVIQSRSSGRFTVQVANEALLGFELIEPRHLLISDINPEPLESVLS